MFVKVGKVGPGDQGVEGQQGSTSIKQLEKSLRHVLLYSVVNLVVIVIVLCTIQTSGGDGLHFMASEASLQLCF